MLARLARFPIVRDMDLQYSFPFYPFGSGIVVGGTGKVLIAGSDRRKDGCAIGVW